MSECQKDQSPFYQCCCQCKWHIKDFGHPLTNGKSVSEQRGWICLAYDLSCAFSGWPEHSVGCEFFEKIKLEESK